MNPVYDGVRIGQLDLFCCPDCRALEVTSGAIPLFA